MPAPRTLHAASGARARQIDNSDAHSIASEATDSVVRRSTPNSVHSARAGLHAIPSRPFRSSLRISVLLPFLNFFSRTGAEKLFGFSEPAPQIPDRALCRLWLWFDPSALGVNVDRTLNTRVFLTVKLLHFLSNLDSSNKPRTRVPPLRARPAGPTGGYVS